MCTLKILLVEKDPTFATWLEMQLKEMGHKVLGIKGNGKEAIEAIFAEQPDMIIMDIQLKGSLSGLDVAKETDHLQIPIIFSTSVNDESNFKEAKKTHSFGYLVKPYDKLTLQSTIEQAAKNAFYEKALPDVKDAWESDVFLQDCFLIKHNNLLKKLMINEILFVKAEGNYCTLSTGKKNFVVKMSLTKLFYELKEWNFCPIHKSYLVSLDKVDMLDISSNKIFAGKDVLPLGNNFKAKVLASFKTLK